MIRAYTTTARRILDLESPVAANLLGLIAAHFATHDALDKATVERLVDEAEAVA